MPDRAPANSLDEIRAELREIKALLLTPAPRPDDLVDAAYVAARTGLKERTVKEGKAGTNAIPRVYLKAEGSKKSLVRYPRSAADNFIRDLVKNAKTPKERALDFMERLHASRKRRPRSRRTA